MVMRTVGSLFSGCGGMDLGFVQAGFDVRWHAEIDRDAVSVLARHWPGVPQLGSVTEIDGAQIEPVDVVIGGFPCQDVSLAGKRAGMAGARSGLFYEFLRIVGEMRAATDNRYPAVAVFENVYGLLSSQRGRDFAAVLAGLRNSGAAVAFRVLDAQFFGVPQRRRRVFLVADFAPVGVGERRAAHVLALGESLCGHPETGAESRQGSAAPAEVGAGVGREPTAFQCHGTNVGPFGTLRSGNGHVTGGVPFIVEPVAAEGGNRTSGPIDGAACLSTSNQRLDFETQTLIVAPWDEAQITSATNRSRVEDGAACPALHRGGTVGVAVAEAQAFDWQAGGGNDTSFRGKSRQYITRAGDYVGALGTTRQDAVAITFEQRIGRNGRGVPSEVVNALKAEAGRTGKGDAAPCVAIGEPIACEIADTLSVGANQTTGFVGDVVAHEVLAGDVAWQESQSGTRMRGDCYGTIDANYGPRRHEGVLLRDGLRWIVRRLTPTEGERCMGWPDGWTRYRADGSEISDSARWRMIGNGVATPVAAWIATRLYAALEAAA